MVNFRTFVFSHELFWGFGRLIDLDEMESIQDIIDCLQNYLITFLKKEKLELLIKKANESKPKLHIHNWTFGSILISDPKETFYVCDHA